MNLLKKTVCLASVAFGLFSIGSVATFAQEKTKADVACYVYVSPAGHPGWTFQHDQGRLAMEKHFDGKVKTRYVENVSEGSDSERIIREMASSGCRVVFGTSFGYLNPITKVAQKFPKVSFLHATGYKSNKTNFDYYNARFYQGRYANGLVAGKVTKTNLVGYIAAFPIPEVLQGINAFTLGLRESNPDAKVRVIWTSSWYDPAKERSAAKTLISQGADILTYHVDSTAVPMVAKEEGKWVVSYHSDTAGLVADTQLTGTTHEWGQYYIDVMDQIIKGTWKPTNLWGGYAEKMVRTLPISSKITGKQADELKALVSSAEKKLIENPSFPFVGPFKNKAGKVILSSGQSMTDEQLNKMNYYVEGVDSPFPKTK